MMSSITARAGRRAKMRSNSYKLAPFSLHFAQASSKLGAESKFPAELMKIQEAMDAVKAAFVANHTSNNERTALHNLQVGVEEFVQSQPVTLASLKNDQGSNGTAGDLPSCSAAASLLQLLGTAPAPVPGNAWVWATLRGTALLSRSSAAVESGYSTDWLQSVRVNDALAARSLLERLLAVGMPFDSDGLWLGLLACSRNRRTGGGAEEGAEADTGAAKALWSMFMAGGMDLNVPSLHCWEVYMDIFAGQGDRQECSRCVTEMQAAIGTGSVYAAPAPAFLLAAQSMQSPSFLSSSARPYPSVSPLKHVRALPHSVVHASMLACLYAGVPMQAFSIADDMEKTYGLKPLADTWSTLLCVTVNSPASRMSDLLEEVGVCMRRAGWDKPTAQHYALMVHAAARCNDLPQAYTFLQNCRKAALDEQQGVQQGVGRGFTPLHKPGSAFGSEAAFPFAAFARCLLNSTAGAGSVHIRLSQALRVMNVVMQHAEHDGATPASRDVGKHKLNAPAFSLVRATVVAHAAAGASEWMAAVSLAGFSTLPLPMRTGDAAASLSLHSQAHANPGLLLPILRACGLHGQLKQGRELLNRHVVGIPSSSFAPEGKQPLYLSFILACLDGRDATAGLEVLRLMQTDGVGATGPMFNALFAAGLAARNGAAMDDVTSAMTQAGVHGDEGYSALLAGAHRLAARRKEGVKGVGRATVPKVRAKNGEEAIDDEDVGAGGGGYLPEAGPLAHLRAMRARVRSRERARGRGRGDAAAVKSRRSGRPLTAREQLEAAGEGETDEEEEELERLVAEGRAATAQAHAGAVAFETQAAGAVEQGEVEEEGGEGVAESFSRVRHFLGQGGGAGGGVRLHAPSGPSLYGLSLKEALALSMVAPPTSTLPLTAVSGPVQPGNGPWAELMRDCGQGADPTPTDSSRVDGALGNGSVLAFLVSCRVQLGPVESVIHGEHVGREREWLGLVGHAWEGGEGEGQRERDRIRARLAGMEEEEGEEENQEGLMGEEEGGGDGEVVYDGNVPFMPHLTGKMPADLALEEGGAELDSSSKVYERTAAARAASRYYAAPEEEDAPAHAASTVKPAMTGRRTTRARKME